MNNKSNLLIATHNPGKKEEIARFLRDLEVKLLTVDDVGITEDVEETEDTLEGNSKKKALFYAKKSGLPALSDDGGLEIYTLNMEPGVKSRRWIDGETESTDEELVGYTLGRLYGMEGVGRKARLRAVITFALPSGGHWQAESYTEGIIAKKPGSKEKTRGYPYRWLFYIPEIGKFYNKEEMTPEEEAKYNHRKQAIAELKPMIQKQIRGERK